MIFRILVLLLAGWLVAPGVFGEVEVDAGAEPVETEVDVRAEVEVDALVDGGAGGADETVVEGGAVAVAVDEVGGEAEIGDGVAVAGDEAVAVPAVGTMYVTAVWEFEVRESPCWGCAILGFLRPGSAVEILEPAEPVRSWRQMRTAEGVVGWMSARYLVEERNGVGGLVGEGDSSGQSASPDQPFSPDQPPKPPLSGGLQDQPSSPIPPLSGGLREGEPSLSGGLLDGVTVAQHEELLRRNQLLQTELDLRNAEIERLGDARWRRFFLYGGGAVLAGMLVSLILLRMRPARRGYSEWA